MSRPKLRLIACAAFAALAVSLPTAAPAAAKVPPGFYGVTPIDSPSDADIVRMGQARVGSMRVMFNWGVVQPTPNGAYDFSDTDRIVRGAAERGIPLLPFLYGTPDWARDCAGIPAAFCDRVDPLRSAAGQSGWPAFARALAGRYGPNGTFWKPAAGYTPPPYVPITQWQIWNEPNSAKFLRPRPAPGAYARLLAVTADSIRLVEPSARIVLGGLFFSPPRGQSMLKFLGKLYKKRGIKSKFDAVALHPYSPDVAGIRFQLEAARKLLRKRDKKTPVLLTEVGWGSQKAKGNKKKRSKSLTKGAKGQKSLLKSSFKFLTAKRGRYKIRGLYWFAWRDLPPGAGGNCVLCESFGLLDAGYGAKPALRAYTRFTGGS